MAERDRTSPTAVYRHLFPAAPGEYEPVEAWVRSIDVNSIPPPDFPHAPHHVETVRAFAATMVNACQLNDHWRSVIDTAVTYHDISQGYTRNGKVPLGPHAVASAIIAYIITENDEVADLVYSHNEDDLPPGDDELDLARIIVRDADQLAFMGYSGLLRAAYYWGFRHRLMSANPKAALHARVLCDPRCSSDGLPPDYEEKVRVFALKHLFPFLVETRQLDRAINFARTNIERFFGADKPEEYFLSALRDHNGIFEKILRREQEIPTMWHLGGSSREIQETNPKYAYLFIRKPLLDYSILQICESIQFAQTNYGQRKAERFIKKSLRPDNDRTLPWGD